MIRSPLCHAWLLLGVSLAAGCGGNSTYTSTTGNYRVDLPSNRKEMVREVASPAGPLKVTMMIGGSEKTGVYSVAWNDYPHGHVQPGTVQNILDNVGTGVINGMKGKEISREPVSLEGHSGREFRFDAPMPGTNGAVTALFRSRAFLVGDRLYQVQVAMPKDSVDTAAAKAFFDSFTLLEKAKPMEANGVSETPAPNLTSPKITAASKANLEGWGAVYDPLNDCRFEPTADGLTITVPGTFHDFNPPPTNRFDAPRVLQDVNGDFTAEVEVPDDPQPSGKSVGPGVPFNGAGLVAFADEANFARLERAAVLRGNVQGYFLFEGRDQGQRIGQDSNMLPGAKHIKLERRGNILAVYASMDGRNWSPLGQANIHWPAAVKVGVMAVNSADQPFSARFKGLKISQP